MKEKGQAYDLNLEIHKSPLYRKKQIETHIGERLNTLLSKTEYEIQGGQMYGFGLSEPFLEVMRSGVGHGNASDRKREEAEVNGFEKIQNLLTKNVPDGTMMISISPKGDKDSVYQHNFYDVFVRKGSRIEARRYSAGLDWQQFGERAKKIGYKGEINDVSFLSNPLVAPDFFQTPDEIHNFFHKEHEYISEADYLLILQICLPSILYYANNPSEISFNAVLNKADFIYKNLDDIKLGKIKYQDIANKFTSEDWGSLPVRSVMTGCGYSQGAQKEPFGVANLSEDKYGKRNFDCPECGKENIRPKDKLVSNCQHCGSSKVGC